MLDRIPAVIVDAIEAFESVNVRYARGVVPSGEDNEYLVLLDNWWVIRIWTEKHGDYCVPQIDTRDHLEPFIDLIRRRSGGEIPGVTGLVSLGTGEGDQG